MKHIETILPEHAADELTRLLLDDATIFSALKELLHRDTGCDIPSLDNVSTSDIEEIIPLCLSILRRFWNTPLTALGDGISKKSLADTFNRLINNRVQGNEAFGIPAANDSIPTAVAALTKRRIFNGEDDGVPDGISLARLMCSDDVEKQALIDDNKGWDLYLPDKLGLHHVFRNIGKKVVLGCKSINHNMNINNGDQTFLKGTFEEGVYFPHLKTITGGYYHAAMFKITTPILDLPELEITDQCRFGGAYDEINMPKFQRVGSSNNNGSAGYHAYQDLITSSTLKHLSLPSFNYLHSSYHYDSAMVRCAILEDISLPVFKGNNSGQINVLAKDCPELLVIDMPSCEVKSWNVAINCPKLHTIVFGKISTFKRGKKGGDHPMVEFENCGNLIKIVIGEGSNGSIDLGNWSPTTALMSDSTAEGYVDLREDITMANNLEQFLWNFQTYIADRVADMTGTTALTLTLSTAVYEALQAQEGQTILATLTNKNWTVAQA